MPSKAAELRELPDEELYVRIESAKEELFNLRFQLATGQLDNSSRLQELRHDVARALTVLRERHLEGEVEAQLARVEAEALERSRAAQESGADQARLKLPDGLYTGIWWYARFPNHYAGEGAVASRELGEFEARTWINGIVQAIRAVKADQESLRLQNEFYERSKRPLDTR